jgi:rhodanese-related sulfurtransferase
MGWQDVPEMSMVEVERRLGAPGFHVFDTNAHARWRRGHVPGAVHVDPAAVTAATMPADRGATLVFYCSGPG